MQSTGCPPAAVATWLKFLRERGGPLRKDDWLLSVALLQEACEGHDGDKEGLRAFVDGDGFDPMDWGSIHEEFSDWLTSGKAEPYEWIWEAPEKSTEPEPAGQSSKPGPSMAMITAVREFMLRGELLGLNDGILQGIGGRVSIQFPDAREDDAANIAKLREHMLQHAELASREAATAYEKQHAKPLVALLAPRYGKFTVHYSPTQGIFRGGTYRLTFDLHKSPSYPIGPPNCHCETPMYHPNITKPSRANNVCHNYLKLGAAHGDGAGYSPALQMAGVVQGVLLLFHEAGEGLGCLNPFDPLDQEIGVEYLNDRETYLRKLEDFKKQHAQAVHIPPLQLASATPGTRQQIEDAKARRRPMDVVQPEEGEAVHTPLRSREDIGAMGKECLGSMEAIDETSYCEYQSWPSGAWRVSSYSSGFVQKLIDTQFQAYLDTWEGVAMGRVECGPHVKKLVAQGPPVFVHDTVGLPLADQKNDERIERFWCMAPAGGGRYAPARLNGALEGEARTRLWAHHRDIFSKMSKEYDTLEARDEIDLTAD